MTNSVTFPTALGGNNITYTDGTGTSGLANGGHRIYFVTMLGQTVIMASSAATNATAAAASAAAAAASAASAVGAAGTQAASSTSMTIGAGSKSLTITTGKLFVVNQWVLVFRTSDPTKYEFGQITAHNSTTGALAYTVLSGNTAGSGTFTDWTIAHVGPQGMAGASGVATYTVKTSSFSVTAGQGYNINGNSVVATLPASPAANEYAYFSAYNLTFTGFSLGRNGNKIMGLAEDCNVDVTYFPFGVRYTDSTTGWVFSE